MKFKNCFSIFIIGILTIIFIGIFGNSSKVNAVTQSYDINSINTTKYPGYKEKLQKLQAKYPNWKIKLVYTGLKWNDVINGEYSGHGGTPKNLTYHTYDGDWICSICGEQRYDVSGNWYCASKEAIEYMMDPRNSLTEEYIFQFQDLSSKEGKKSDIELMTQNTFLFKATTVNAIMRASEENNVSPFHITARILQEQGTNGTGLMNGYIYNQMRVYNLFNINVSGNSSQGYENGAKFAYDNQWFTQEASIVGGTKYIKEKYIDKGQTTLYFQKFNVIQQGNLYNHQYMQNVRAANDEGYKMYKTYRDKSLLKSAFEFAIPVYENMPATAAKQPLTSKYPYEGAVNSELQSIKLDKNNTGKYIYGNIVIVEWKNGKSTVPSITPRMTIESTDGKIKQQIFIKHISGNTYYYDKYIDGLDKSKQYKIYVDLAEPNNVSPNKKAEVKIKNQELGLIDITKVMIENNSIKFIQGYIGNINSELKEIKLEKNEKGIYYISGKIVVVEWVDGKSTVPKEKPKMRFKSTDGKVNIDVFVTATGTNTYYFDRFIDGIDTSKSYVFEISSGSDLNLSTSKTMNVYFNGQFNNKNIGIYKDKNNIILENNKIVFKPYTYIGNINSELKNIGLNKNEKGNNYISGEIVIVEWVNGKSTVPKEKPKMRFKSTDGKINIDVFVTATGTNTYYFDRFIEGIDTSKSYVFEVSSGSTNNVSNNKTMNVYLKNQKIGIYKNKSIILENNQIKFK